jgi:chaperone modulatory protein CbpM
MSTFDDILRVHHLQQLELQAWIEQRWVRPRATAEGLVFDDVDEARIALICELREEFMVNDDAVDMMLCLLDQLYATRRVLRCVEEAIEALPPDLREEVRARISTDSSS